MAIITVSTQELKKGIPLEPKWYGATLRECKVEPTKDKSGLNFNFYFMIEDGTTEGREFKHTINEHAKGNLKPVYEALMSTEDNPVSVPVDQDLKFDTDEVAGKYCKVKIENEVYQGNPVNKLKAFVPYFKDVENIPFG